MSNYKIGDRVKIIGPPKPNDWSAIGWDPYEMSKNIGKIATLKKETRPLSKKWFLEEDFYWYSEEWLELVKPKGKLTYKEFMKSFKEE